MTALTWTNTADIAAKTAYAIPAEAGLPAGAMLVDVISVTVAPLASAGAASTTSPLTETRVAPNTAAPAAGEVSLQTTGANAQKLLSGDDIPADAVVTAVVLTQADGVIQ